jgi:hypothetical protein
MAAHALIAGYLDRLTGRLPAEVIDELADGLHETFQRHLGRGLGPDDAAAATVAEFGRPAQVVAAFVRQSPRRRTALGLLATSPAFAAVWGATLITAQAWTWQIPSAAAVGFAVALLMIAGSLAAVALSNEPRRTRLAAPAGLGLMVLEIAVLAAVALAAPEPTWPMALAIPASLARLTLTARAGPTHPRPVGQVRARVAASSR